MEKEKLKFYNDQYRKEQVELTSLLKAMDSRLDTVMKRNAELFKDLEAMKKDAFGKDYCGQEPDDFHDKDSRALLNGRGIIPNLPVFPVCLSAP